MNPLNLSTPLRPRILVATPDQKLRLCLARMLERLGFTVRMADDTSEATTILLYPDPPEIALLDSALPDPGGLELAIEIKRDPKLRQMWVVLLARAADSATIAAAAQAGLDDLLLCPTCKRLDGSFQPEESESALEADLQIRLAVGTRNQELGNQLEAQTHSAGFHASHDQLTGLWNRESLLSLLFPETDRVQRMGTPLAFLLLDVDRFAVINSEYGYEVGNRILHELGNRLRRYVRSYDLVGRCRDDEFLIALPGCNSVQATHLANRIRTILLRRPFEAGDRQIHLTASIGLAHSRGRSPLIVLREAEHALATAKRNGRNREHGHLPNK